MKKFHFFLFASLVVIAVSCKTTRSSISVQEKSETVSQSSDRLSSFSLSDSIFQHFMLNADSLVLFFDATPSGSSIKDTHQSQLLLAEKSSPSPDAATSDDVYFFSNSKPPAVTQPPADADGLRTAHPKPKALKVYGLHVDKNTNKHSAQQSSLTESNDKSEHSDSHKEDNKTKSSPSSAPKYIFYILIIAIAFYIYKRLRP